MELQLLVHWESLSKRPGATFAQIFGIFSGHFGHLLRILTFRSNLEPIGVPELLAITQIRQVKYTRTTQDLQAVPHLGRPRPLPRGARQARLGAPVGDGDGPQEGEGGARALAGPLHHRHRHHRAGEAAGQDALAPLQDEVAVEGQGGRHRLPEALPLPHRGGLPGFFFKEFLKPN